MRLCSAALAASLLVTGILPVLAEQRAPILEMSADGEVQIAPDGHVSDYQLHSKLSPAIANLVDRNVRTWRFEPVVVDGAPVVAKTAIHLDLKAEPIAGKDDYGVRLVNVRFGEPHRNAHMKPPRYPQEAVHARLGAKVVLCLRLDETGKVVDVQPYQTSLDARPNSENEAKFWRDTFEKASMAAARNWQYDLSETVNGRPIGTSAMVPIVYSLRGPGIRSPAPGEWKPYLPGPVHPAPWLNAKQLADHRDFSLPEDGQALSLDSRFRLKDEVVGKIL